MNLCKGKNETHKVSYQIYNSYKEVDISAWEHFSKDNVFLTLNYLKSLEESLNEIKKFYYTLYFNHNKAIGISVFQKTVFDLKKHSLDNFPCNIGSKVIKPLFKKPTTILIAGNIYNTGENIFCFDKNVSKSDALNYSNLVVKHILKTEKEIKYVVYKEFWETSTYSKLLSKKLGYLPFNIDVNMVVNTALDIQNMDDYKKLFTAKCRTRVNKVIEKSKELKCIALDLETLINNKSNIVKLYTAVLENSEFNMGNFTFETFFGLKKNLPNHYFIDGYFKKDKLVGFKSYFDRTKSIEASFIGLDYSINKQYNIYQKMLIDYMNLALSNNKEKLYLGRTAETVKSNFGALPIPMNLYIKHRNQIGHKVLKQFIGLIKPSEYTLRQPFKTNGN